MGLGWLYGADLWALRVAQEPSSGLLDSTMGLFSLFGSQELTGVALLLLLVGLTLRGRRLLAGRLLVAFIATGIIELAMKLYLPQAPIPQETVRAGDHAPLVAVQLPYPYPSGHVLRGVIVLGALYLLWRNPFPRAGLLVLLAGLAASRIYLGVHWASDVLGGALLGIVALLWAFGKEGTTRWRSR